MINRRPGNCPSTRDTWNETSNRRGSSPPPLRNVVENTRDLEIRNFDTTLFFVLRVPSFLTSILASDDASVER